MALVVRESAERGLAAPGAAPGAAPSPPIPTLTVGVQWELLSQTTHVHVDLERANLHGTVELRLRLPSAPAAAPEVRLNCAPTCVVHRCLLDGVPLDGEPRADDLVEAIVPERWQRTRDLPSFQRCHGAATFVGSYQHWDEPRGSFHGGELRIALPAAPPPPAAADGGPGEAAPAAEGPPRQARDVSLTIEYSVPEPRGGVHFARRGAGGAAAYAHTIGEAGAPRRWMPCVDCIQVRCPVRLHVTAAAGLAVHASGVALGSSAAEGGGRRTWSFVMADPVLASQVGFVVGRLASATCGGLSSAPHPELAEATLVLGTLLPPSLKPGLQPAGTHGGGPGGTAAAADAERWPQLYYLSRHLPSVLGFLRSHLLAPCVAVLGEAAAKERALEAERAEAERAAAGAAPPAGRAASVVEPSVADPFHHHTLVVLDGAFAEASSFAGLVILSSSVLHPAEAVEPARPSRRALCRAVGRSWIDASVWLESWSEAWLLMAVEGRMLLEYTRTQFGEDEAQHALSLDRAALFEEDDARGGSATALVPDASELDQWGGDLHPEQLFTPYRQRKALLVYRMVEKAIRRTEGGRRSFDQILSRIASFPPRKAATPRISSTAMLVDACQAVRVSLKSFADEWIYSAKPCPTLRANFAFNRPLHKIELVVVQQPAPDAAQLGEMPLSVGWGEPDPEGTDAALSRLHPPHRLSASDRQQSIEVIVNPTRRRRRKKRARGGDDEEGGSLSGPLPLLWLNLDPHLDLALRVQWTGRPDAPMWNGLPEEMSREELLNAEDVPSQVDAAVALSTFETRSAVSALLESLRKNVYFRVRTAAIASLAALVSPRTEYAALDGVLSYLKEKHYEGAALRPNDFSDFGEYAVLKAAVEALGTCRDAAGHTPADAYSTLLELLEDNDNGANAFEDGCYLGCVLRALASCAPEEAGASRALVAQVNTHIRLDAVQPSHDCVLTRSALQALCTHDLGASSRGRAVDLALYWHYEEHGATASLRLAAADCLLRLTLLLPAAALAAAAAAGDAPRTMLSLALVLSERRGHAPLEQLWLWTAVRALLTSRGEDEASQERHEAGLRRERSSLGVLGEPEAVATVQLLWRAMTLGSAGHVRLRYVLCDVWRALFADRPPACLGANEPIGYEQVLADYVPLHEIRARRQALVDGELRASNPQEALKTNRRAHFVTGKVGMIGFDEIERVKKVVWKYAEADDERVAAALPDILDAYRAAAKPGIATHHLGWQQELRKQSTE